MRIDHIGYAVKDIDKAKRPMETLGFMFGDTVEDQERNVRLVFGKTGGYQIELVAPMDGTSPVDTYLSRIGPTPYHICYKSKNIEADIEKLERKRFKVSVPLTPAAAFGGKRVVFLYSLEVGLVELVEE